MKKFSLILSTLLMLSFAPVFASAASAAYNFFPTCNNSSASSSAACQDAKSSKSKNPFITIIKDVITVVSYISGVAAVILIVVSALKFVTAGGSAESVASARGTLLYALIGVAVTVLAQSFIAFVLDKIR